MRIEPSGSSVWSARVGKLATILRDGYEARELLQRAKFAFGWTEHLTRHVLAAGDGGVLIYRGGRWRKART